MRYWSRILALLLTVLLCIPLFSCTGDKLTTQPEKTTEGVLNWAGRGKEEQKTTPEPELYPITFGLSTGKNYFNPYFNLELDLDESWFVAQTLQLDEANSFSAEVPQGKRKKEYLDFLAQGKAVRDFYAQSNTGLLEIDINVTKRTADDSGDPYLTDYHMEYVETMRELMKQSGAELKDENFGIFMLGEEVQTCFYYSYDFEGYTVYCAHALIPGDDYLLSLFASSIEKDHVRELLALFFPHA